VQPRRRKPKVAIQYTVYIRKPDVRLSNVLLSDMFLGPTFEWKKQDGGYHSKAGKTNSDASLDRFIVKKTFS
jgi:hypothetical protein